MSEPVSAQSERQKYRKVWGYNEYRRVAPGERFILPFLEMVRPEPASTILDIGTGTGRAAVHLQRLGFDVVPIDIADNALSASSEEELLNTLTVVNVWEALPIQGSTAFCTDVMEHIPPNRVDDVLSNIGGAVDEAFFSISFSEASFDTLVEEHLHLTVQPYTWWLRKLADFGEVIDARDMLKEGVFHVRF